MLINYSFSFRTSQLLGKCVQRQTVSSTGLRCASNLRQEDSKATVPPKVQAFIDENVAICQPDSVYVCDGSDAENDRLFKYLTESGVTHPLKKFPNR